MYANPVITGLGHGAVWEDDVVLYPSWGENDESSTGDALEVRLDGTTARLIRLTTKEPS